MFAHSLTQSRRHSIAFGAALAVMALAGPADANDLVHKCLASPGSEDTATVVFHPRLFGVDGHETDGDVFKDDFEHRFTYAITVTDYDPAKPGWTGPQRCKITGGWGTNWKLPNIRYEFMVHNPGAIIYIENVPRYSKVELGLRAVEDDSGEDDVLDFDPSPNGADLGLIVFVNQKQARTMVGARQGRNDVALNKAKRVIGDGNIGYDGDRVRAFLEFVANVHPDQTWRTAPVMGKIKGNKIPGVGLTPKPAPTPATHPKCKDYALRSVQQNQEQLKLGCGFQPPVWSNDHQMHFDWCVKGNNVKSAQGWIQKRDKQLASCKQAKAKTPTPAATCKQYANQAMSAIAQAMQLNCQGLSGPRWLLDYNAHFNWCMTGVSKAVLDSEKMARNAAIQTCIANNRK